MNRAHIVTGSAVALLAAAGVGELYLDKAAKTQTPPRLQSVPAPEPPQAAETKPVGVEEVIGTFLKGIEEGSETSRLVNLGGLLDELESPEYAKAAIPPESAETLAKAALEASPQGESEESAKLRKRLVEFLASRTRGETSRGYILKVLEEGSAELKVAALSKIGSPQGVGGKAVFEKIRELGEKGLIAEELLPAALRRTGGKKAVEPIMALMRSTDNWKTVSACAVALEDLRDPSLMGPILERLDQTGILDKPKMLPWISPKMLSQHLEKAEGLDLTRALKVLKARPSLVKSGLAAVQKGLETEDPETRRIAAEAIKKAVLAKSLDAKRAESLLAGRLGHETEPVLKAELAGGLEQVRGLMEPQKKPETKQQ